MLKNAKAKGRRNERRSAKILEGAGYRTTLSAASLGCFDLVGISSADVVLVQVKSNCWPGVAEIEAIRMFPCPSNTRKLVHRWDDRIKLPIVKEYK